MNVKTKPHREHFLRTMAKLTKEEQQQVYHLIVSGKDEADAATIISWRKELKEKHKRG